MPNHKQIPRRAQANDSILSFPLSCPIQSQRVCQVEATGLLLASINLLYIANPEGFALLYYCGIKDTNRI
jgi:hypothetical protein